MRLTEHRLKAILADCQTNADKLLGTQGAEQKQIGAAIAKVGRNLNNLYKLVEDEKVRIDSSLGARIQTWQDELKELTAKRNSIKVPIALPKNIINAIDVGAFQTAMISILKNPDTEDAKAFIHLVVDDIRVYAEEVCVSVRYAGGRSVIREGHRTYGAPRLCITGGRSGIRTLECLTTLPVFLTCYSFRYQT